MFAFLLFFVNTYLVFFSKPGDQAEGTRLAEEELKLQGNVL
jgi:hypothetical protein